LKRAATIVEQGLGLLLENTRLTKTGHPILCVPRTNNFPVFEFVDIDNLNVHFSVLGRKTHERLALSARHFGANGRIFIIFDLESSGT
jgi:hypothetical protein